MNAANAYYAQKLSADRLDRVYAIACPRVRQYLQAEMDHVQAAIRPGDRVLELGCGTGRVLVIGCGALAREILAGIAGTPDGERYLLGCPSGRSLRSTYRALARLVPPDADLSRLVLVMMDEYVVGEPGAFARIDPGLTHTCAWFAEHEIRRPLSAAVPPVRSGSSPSLTVKVRSLPSRRILTSAGWPTSASSSL